MDDAQENPSRRWRDLSPIPRESNVPPAPLDVREIRRRLHLTQAQFAGYFGFSVATLRHWERGNRRPSGTALILLHVIASDPRAVRIAVRRARRTFPGSIPEMELRSFRAPPGLG
jgi:DNA-binding transcriptional regulator YiaG